MRTGTAITHLVCRDCGETYDLDLTDYPCRECGGILDPQYDLESLAIDRSDWSARSVSMWNYRELLAVRDRDAIVSMGEGRTPLVDCPTLAEALGVDELLVKDEGQNPTYTFKDRWQAAAISAALERGAETVALPSARNAGQAASATSRGTRRTRSPAASRFLTPEPRRGCSRPSRRPVAVASPSRTRT